MFHFNLSEVGNKASIVEDPGIIIQQPTWMASIQALPTCHTADGAVKQARGRLLGLSKPRFSERKNSCRQRIYSSRSDAACQDRRQCLVGLAGLVGISTCQPAHALGWGVGKGDSVCDCCSSLQNWYGCRYDAEPSGNTMEAQDQLQIIRNEWNIQSLEHWNSMGLLRLYHVPCVCPR